MGSVVNLAIEMMGGTDGSYVAGEPTTPRSSRRATLTATSPPKPSTSHRECLPTAPRYGPTPASISQPIHSHREAEV